METEPEPTPESGRHNPIARAVIAAGTGAIDTLILDTLGDGHV